LTRAREYHVSSSDVNPAIAEPVSPTERSSPWREASRTPVTVEQRVHASRRFSDVVIWRKSDGEVMSERRRGARLLGRADGAFAGDGPRDIGYGGSGETSTASSSHGT
jgi:hypothetical protein